MPYMELRNYKTVDDNISLVQRDDIMKLVRDKLTRGQEIDGTFEFRILNRASELDWCEYEYILVIDMGHTVQRENDKVKIAETLALELSTILRSKSVAVRLRLQNAGFVPFKT